MERSGCCCGFFFRPAGFTMSSSYESTKLPVTMSRCHATMFERAGSNAGEVVHYAHYGGGSSAIYDTSIFPRMYHRQSGPTLQLILRTQAYHSPPDFFYRLPLLTNFRSACRPLLTSTLLATTPRLPTSTLPPSGRQLHSPRPGVMNALARIIRRAR